MSTAGSFNLTVALPFSTNQVWNFSMLFFSCKKRELANVKKIISYNLEQGWAGMNHDSGQEHFQNKSKR